MPTNDEYRTDEYKLSTQQQNSDPEHYEDCPQHSDPAAPNCHCEGINQAEENYRAEPPGFLG
jgi:hypothetical protein